MPARFTWVHLLVFLLGLDVLFVAMAPPLEALAGRVADGPHDPAPPS